MPLSFSLAEDKALTSTTPSILLASCESSTNARLERVLLDDYEILIAEDKHTAWHLLREHTVSLILLGELADSPRSSFSLLEILRQQQDITSARVVLVGSLAEDKTSILQGLDLGIVDYLPHSLDGRLLHQRVAAHIAHVRYLADQDRYAAAVKKVQGAYRRMLRMIAHDIKAPLNNIGMAESLLRQYAYDCSQILPVLDSMTISTETMREVVEDFMNAAVMHDAPLNLSVIPVGKVLYDIALQYSTAAGAKEIEISVAQDPGVVYADLVRLRQILGNLVSNAIKYSPTQTLITIGTESHDALTRVYVQDQGPGVAEDERHVLFTEFGRTNNRPTGTEGSTGLGLWIVRNLTQTMDGECGVDFPEEGGSRFWIDLPSESTG